MVLSLPEMQRLTSGARKRTKPSIGAQLYGKYDLKMSLDKKFRDDVTNRAAYVFVTGQFPTHLRSTFTDVIRVMTIYFRRPVALDGRSGNMKLKEDVIRDLELERHAMVRKVREKISSGYLIQPSRDLGTRRNYWKIFMFKFNADGIPYDRIVVQGDGSVKEAWQ